MAMYKNTNPPSPSFIDAPRETTNYNEYVNGVASAQKFDAGKPPLGLIPKVFTDGVASVLAFGAQKYSRNQWRSGMEWSRLIDAALRHITAFNEGEDIDPESGLSHLYHAGCCLAFLSEYEKTSKRFDDRYDRHNRPSEETVSGR